MRTAYPGVAETGETLALPTRSLEDICDESAIDECEAILVLDIQGHEAAALRGLGRYVRHFRRCVCEIATERVYENQALFAEIDELMTVRRLPAGFAHASVAALGRGRRLLRGDVRAITAP